MAQADNVIKLLKSVTQTLSQYKAGQSSDGHLLQVVLERIQSLRQAVSSSKSLSQLSHSSLPVLDCLSGIVAILTDPVSPSKLLLACLQVIHSLASSRELRVVLQVTLQITAVLTGLLQQDDDANFQLTCLKTVQAITYNAVFTASDGYIEQLIRHIVPFILSPLSDRTVPSLAILANVTRRSVSVQAYVKSLPNCRALLRTLISCLSNANVSIIVCSLAPLTSLCLHDELGTKLFNSKNVDQSFQLVFGLLTDDPGPLVIQYAVDLFCDLLTAPAIAQALTQYPNLAESLQRVVNRLEHSSPDSVCKLLELLCHLCTVPSLGAVRRDLCKLILSPPAGRETSLLPPFLSVLKSATTTENHYTALQAWKLLPHLFKVAQDENMVAAIAPHFAVLMRAVAIPLTELVNIQLWSTADSDCLLTQKCVLAATVLEFLISVVQEQQFCSEVAQHITPDLCSHLLEQQLGNNPGVCESPPLPDTRDAASGVHADHWSIAGVQVAFLTLQLLSFLSKHSTQFEVQLQRTLQDARLFPFFASSLRSEKKQHVQRGLSILVAACRQANEGDMSRLAGVLANLNFSQHRQQSSSYGGYRTGRTNSSSSSSSGLHPSQVSTTTGLSSQGMTSSLNMQSTGMTSSLPRHCVAQPMQTSGQSSTNHVGSPPSSQTGEVQALIERMQTGLDLKDIRAHEIMEIYEHELATRNTKESHLQDLLEAKTMALSQADRLIAQYRCRRAQSESECAKLRGLLQECEKRSASQHVEIETLVAGQQEMQLEIKQLEQSRQQLDRLLDEHSQLRNSYDEQKHKLEGTMRSLSAAQEEQASLSDLLDMQRKHCDKLKAQFESSNSQLEALERQHQLVVQQLSEKEMQCNELQHSLQQCEKQLAAREQDCAQLQRQHHATTADLGRAEEAKHQLARQVAMLEEERTQLKRRLERAENELDKHRKLREMIHSLSGGVSGSQAASQAM